MNAMMEEQEITLVKLCVKRKMFSFWKFYNSYGDGQFTRNEKRMCGFLIRWVAEHDREFKKVSDTFLSLSCAREPHKH